MGGSFEYGEYKDMPRDELNKKFVEAMRRAAYMYGHGGYTGTIAEKRYEPVEFHDRQFSTRQEAVDYLLTENDKWGPAFAVSFIVGGEKRWLFGGWCSD
jgi:hypothetical protein